MSENLVSEPMTLDHGTRMNPTMMQTDSSTTNPLMGSLASFNNNSALQQTPISNFQGIRKDAMMNLTDPQEIFMSNESMGNFQAMPHSFSAQHVPQWQLEQMKALQANQGQQNTSLSVKRKASPDNVSPSNQGMQRISVSTRRMTQVRAHSSSSVPSVLSVADKLSAQAGTVSYSPKSGNPSRKVLQLEAVPNRSHPQMNRSEVSPKVQSEPFGSVRSKLREQFAAALALVSQQHKTLSKTERPGQSESGSMEVSNQGGIKAANSSAPVIRPGEELKDGQSVSEGGAGANVEPWKMVGQVLPYEDMPFTDNFFAKDELLLGNGLAWEMELDGNLGGANAAKQPRTIADTSSGVGEESCLETESAFPSPDVIAMKIESELFKLFGGLNKKYKEKGRSLMFNLKDKNNPELRERVMAGEISPERLCSMTAEELASRELSEWRIAKAEQLAHMKELPDSDVDLRRLVKKTHKGEFEVEAFEPEISAPVDGLVGGNSVVRDRSEVNGSEARSPTEAEAAQKTVESKGKSGTTGGDTEGTFTIPSESGDIMQGLMVDDMKDLPPIVSLDEFMESLDKEPPFENLPLDSDKSTPASDNKASSDGGSESKSTKRASKVSAENVARKTGDAGSKRIGNAKPIPIKREYVWEGVLQLTVTSTANFGGVLKSGEKTGTKDWPRFIEIKGRVRLEAFEKFIHELPNSRSRAIMMVHFSLDAACTDKDQANLQELVDSYLADERLGFAEPTPGTEVYFVPPGAKTVEMLNKHLPTSYTRTLDAIENGLIGVVVWRKAQVPPPAPIISPKSSSSLLHHKNSALRQQNSYPPATPIRPSHDRNMNSNVNFAARDVVVPPPSIISRSNPDNDNNEEDDDDDDVPPGFGPQGGAKRDDDDLPEFSFSGSGSGSSSNPISTQKIPVQGIGNIPERLPSPTPAPPQDKYRQLILKYGQKDDPTSPPPPPLPLPPSVGVGGGGGGGGGIVLQPWNDDEDDDIPEWQPQEAVPPSQPPIRPHMGMGMVNSHQVQHLLPLQPPMAPLPQMGAPNVGPWQQPQSGGGWWGGGSVNRGRQQHHHHQGGRPWMPDGSSRSRNNRGSY